MVIEKSVLADECHSWRIPGNPGRDWLFIFRNMEWRKNV